MLGLRFAWDGVKAAFSGGVPGVLAALGPLGAAVGITMAAWRPLTGFFVGLWDGVKSVIGGAIDWIGAKVGSVLAMADKVKGGASTVGRFFGVSPGAPAAAAGGRPAAPPLPEAAMRGAITNNTATTNVGGITIVQQPGQDARKLADEVARELEHRQGVRSRSAMYDGAR
jgi:hypothetical protein